MPLVDMKTPPKERDKEKGAECAPCYDPPLYPYGLRIFLDEESLQKLGMSQDDFEIGDEFPLRTKVRVIGKSDYQTEENQRQNVDLQIIAIEKPGGASKAERMFAGEKEKENAEG